MRALSVNEMNVVCGSYKSNEDIWNDLKSGADAVWSGIKAGASTGGVSGKFVGMSTAGAALGAVAGAIYAVDTLQMETQAAYENYSHEGRNWLSESGGSTSSCVGGVGDDDLPAETAYC